MNWMFNLRLFKIHFRIHKKASNMDVCWVLEEQTKHLSLPELGLLIAASCVWKFRPYRDWDEGVNANNDYLETHLKYLLDLNFSLKPDNTS